MVLPLKTLADSHLWLGAIVVFQKMKFISFWIKIIV